MTDQEFDPRRVHKHHYSPQDFELARGFALRLQAELKDFVREIVFFGSAARGKATEIYERDIDVLVVVNDATATLSNETVAAYRIITEKAAGAVSGRLHINTLRISAFWEYVLNGDPVAMNIIRDGAPLLGAGFFEPFKKLLENRAIVPSKENIMVYMIRAPQTLMASRWHLLQATIDLYWAGLDAIHAALIHYGFAPTSPAETIEMLDSHFVRRKRVDKAHLATIKALYAMSNGITDRSVKDVRGDHYAAYETRTRALVGEMKQLMSGRAG